MQGAKSSEAGVYFCTRGLQNFVVT